MSVVIIPISKYVIIISNSVTTNIGFSPHQVCWRILEGNSWILRCLLLLPVNNIIITNGSVACVVLIIDITIQIISVDVTIISVIVIFT